MRAQVVGLGCRLCLVGLTLAGHLAAAGCSAGNATGAAPSAAASPSPSILLVTIDTLRADHLGCYGRQNAETPHLDRLAREGVRFEEARSHVPLTLPSHASILTGRLPPRHGVRGNGLFRLGGDVPTLATALKGRGYRTAAVVSSVVLDRAYGLARGFELYDDNQRVGEKTAFNYLERGASQIARTVASALPRLEPPFFMWVHLYDPHTPWIPPEPFRGRHAARLYDAEIAFADAAFGEIWQAAAARAGGRLIVAATSDHGESLGDHGENQHGYTLHRGVLRVPLLLAGEGIPAGIRISDTVGLVDLAPTLADLAGASLPGADGTSLRPLWADSDERASLRKEAPATALWEETLHPLYDSGWAPLRGLLTARWHFVEAPRPELYDRTRDPDDREEVSKKHPEIVADLRRRLAQMGASIGDVAEPSVLEDDSPEEMERRAKLASLGYLTAGVGAPHGSSRLDPKDGLPGFLAIEKAALLIGEGKGKEARALLEPHSRTDPYNPRLWHQIGEAAALAGDLEAAERAFKKALDLDAHGDFIRYSYAALLAKKGDGAGQQAQLETILAKNPRAADATLILAAMAVASGHLGRSEAMLKASYDAGVRDPDLLDRLGHHLLKRGKPDEAARYFEEALEIRPEDPAALLETGRTALRGNNAGRAIELLNRCVVGERAFECRIELARAYVVGPRNLAAARIHLEAARSLASDDRMRRDVDARLEALDRLQGSR